MKSLKEISEVVVILMVNYFRSKLTKFYIESLVKTVPKKNYRLVIIDNHSPDNSGKMLLEYNKLGVIDYLVLNEKNYHETHALNQGLEIIKERFKDLDYFMWGVQDFFHMGGWYENVSTVFNDLNLDFVSCCFLEGLTNEKVISSSKEITINGGKYSPLNPRRPRRYPYDVGHAPLVKMKYIVDNDLKIDADDRTGFSSQMEFYYKLQMEWDLQGCRLYKPCLLMQDSEFNNPEYIPYYKFIHGKENNIHMKKWLRKFMRQGHVFNPEKYYEGSGYKISEYYSAGEEAFVDWGFNPEIDLPYHKWE